jgi:hypothetical protein
MTTERQGDVFDREAQSVSASLPDGRRLGIIGSTSFWHADSQATCNLLGELLAELDGLLLLTGGVEGVGEAVGRSFHAARTKQAVSAPVVHVLPHGYPPWDYGTTVFAGADMAERREIFATLAGLYIAVEGGPGTAHEASVALGRQALVVPVGRSGGHAGILYGEIAPPAIASGAAWRTLGSPRASPLRVARAVVEVVASWLQAWSSDPRSS